MVKPKDDLHLSLPPQSLNIDAGQDCNPITPIDRSFTNVDTSSFVTAILSPSSHDVFAARARARSRSDAPPLSSTAALNAASRAIHNSPSLDSISVARPCGTICEGDTSPVKADDESKGPALQTLYESPSIARRSRLLSSTGNSINATLFDSFAPLTLHKIGEGVQTNDESTKAEGSPSRLLSSRPRASTLSVPTSSLYPTLANFNPFRGTTPTPVTANPVSRLRSSSHYDKAQGSGNNDDIRLKDTHSPYFNLPDTTKANTTTSSSNSEGNFRPLSTQSSHGSLDTRYDSSFESSFGVSDLSMTLSNSFSETFDTFNESGGHDASSWRVLQQSHESMYDGSDENIFKVSENLTGASSTVSIASHSTLNIITAKDYHGRRKSHTISGLASPHCMGLQVQQHKEQQDVFGPTTTVNQSAQSQAKEYEEIEPISSTTPAPIAHQLWASKSSNQLNVNRDSKPRRLTMGGGMPPPAKSSNSRAALILSHKPDSPLEWNHTPSKGRRPPVLSVNDPISPDQSVMAFQELIGAMRNERPIKSMAIEEVTSAEPKSIGAVLEYRRCSPTGQRPEGKGQECQLCGSVARRLTMLEPCGHLACAVCCSSGLNQVTATPPRPHLCAACHTHVQGITLRKEVFDYDGHSSTPLQTPRAPRHRPQTPSPDEQRMLYRNLDSSSPVKVFPKYGPAAKMEQRRRSGSRMVSELANASGEMSSSDLLTEDQSFYQSQRAIQQHFTPRRIGPNCSPTSVVFPRSYHLPEGSINKLAVRSTTAQGTSIVRVDNIPWTVTYNDVIEWLPQPSDSILPDTDVSSASIHIPVDVFSGKTSNCCFVECKNKEEAMRLVRHRNNNRLLGRPVSLMISTLDDLLNEIFPARVDSPSQMDNECIFFSAIHLRQLVELLKKGGVQLKGPLKIVDVTTSMIRLVPANMSPILSDMLFERAKEIVCICIAASQEMSTLRQSLDRLLLACSSCACFSVNQRFEILDSARGTLTTLTQLKQIPALFPSAPLTFAPHPASTRDRMSSKNELLSTSPQRVATWQANQHSRLSSEAALLQQQASALEAEVARSSMSWPYSSPLVEKRAAHTPSLMSSYATHARLPTSTMAASSSPPRQRSLQHQSNSPVEPCYRETALQTLLDYGVNPSANAEGFENMVNQLAQALAKQQVKT